MASLATQQSQVRKQVAITIAQIASIEIPRREWLELLPNLCSNSTHQQPEIRNAALETLGFICEEIAADDLTTELKGFIVEALVTNISDD